MIFRRSLTIALAAALLASLPPRVAGAAEPHLHPRVIDGTLVPEAQFPTVGAQRLSRNR